MSQKVNDNGKKLFIVMGDPDLCIEDIQRHDPTAEEFLKFPTKGKLMIMHVASDDPDLCYKLIPPDGIGCPKVTRADPSVEVGDTDE